MRHRWSPVILLAATLAILVPTTGACAKWNKTKSPSRAPINIQHAPAGDITETLLTDEVFDKARPDLSDLRVGSDPGGEIPYVTRRSAAKTQKTALTVEIYNKTFIAGQTSSVTVNFQKKIMKNYIEVDTPGANFRRPVTVEGSDDGKTWETVLQRGYLFRIASDDRMSGYDKDHITIPNNNHQYLRVTVLNAPDDPDHIEIVDVRAWHVIVEPAETSPVSIVRKGTEQKEDSTTLYFDLGYRNMPMNELRLDFNNKNFFRTVVLSGRNAEKRTIKRQVADAPALEKVIDEPWVHISHGAIYRYTVSESIDESVILSLENAPYRYIKVVIRNGDDKPLSFTEAAADRLVQKVLFQPGSRGDHFLYLGGSETTTPKYDLPNYVDRLYSGYQSVAALEEVVDNPFYNKALPAPPWSERFKWVIWLVLLGILVYLGSMVYREVKNASE